MLVDPKIMKAIIQQYDIDITGVLHIGAHECEEMPFYNVYLGIPSDNIIWIDAMESKVRHCREKEIPNVHHAVITDKDDDTVDFHIANNGQSSSILEMKTHLEQYSYIYYVDKIRQNTITIDTFFKLIEKSPEKYVFWNFDIQGAELLALKGAKEAIKNVKLIYLEVNVDELYKDCARIGEVEEFLTSHGFQRVHLEMSQYGWGDAVYVHKSMIK